MQVSIYHFWKYITRLGRKILRSYLNDDDWISKLESDRKCHYYPDFQGLDDGHGSSNVTELRHRMRLIQKVDLAPVKMCLMDMFPSTSNSEWMITNVRMAIRMVLGYFFDVAVYT